MTEAKSKDKNLPPALRGVFRKAHGSVPYERRDVLEIGNQGRNDKGEDYAITDKDKPNENRAVNFEYILRTGHIPIHDGVDWQTLNHPRAYHIDWASNDAYTQSIKTIEELVAERIQDSEKLQKLLEKKEWTKEDRETWEQEVSKFVAQEMHSSIPGMRNYRSYQGGDGASGHKRAETDSARLNDLGKDIENNTEKHNFNCIAQSVIMGAVMQKMDKRFLPSADSVEKGNMRHATNYFFATGARTIHGASNKMIGHAFVVSPLTGNMIEATSNPWSSNTEMRTDPYSKTQDGYTFMDFLNGKPAYTEPLGNIYGMAYTERNIALARASEGKYGLADVQKMVEKMSEEAMKTGKMPEDVPPEMQKLVLMQKQYKDLYAEMQKAGSDAEKEEIRKRLGVLNDEYLTEMDKVITTPESLEKLLKMLGQGQDAKPEEPKSEASQDAKAAAPAP